jgi:hypothetical protein
MDLNGYLERSPVHLDITFKDGTEAKSLLEELTQWTPHGGWSENAALLFQELAVLVLEAE